ncbi:hypothetical protein JOC85_001451 [Bacillus mesophilus]|uniref:Uncharacterized protein n=1 Tax=Bacillus mesophilus TaxID=1808955 RepID=A0A6M0Q656_9BACI|nr:hypothetical protein [Bacillus mesophilus]MBM7660679.1 hypothetical protein [Bacillus mesophilus]NEY71774.1 hypothetical protein [Bacillus mesophilus]
MKIESVIILVNKMCDESRYTKAREIIYKEWDRLTESKTYTLLNKNAKEFVMIIKAEKEDGSFEALTFSEKKTLNLFNQYIRDTNLSFAKRIYHANIELFEKKAAQNWLHGDAKIFYDAWKKFINEPNK